MNLITNKDTRFGTLLFFLLLYIFGSPFLEGYPSLGVLAHASLTMSLFISVYAVQKQMKYRSFTVILLFPVVILYWIGIYEAVPLGREGSYLLLALFYGMLIIAFVSQLASFNEITPNVVFGVLCVYLLAGLFWGALYALMSVVSPGSFSGALLNNTSENYLHVFNYFSMVTITTLGYGDIIPQTLGAGSLCQLEAIVGQLFIAVVVGWIVGNYVSEKKQKTKENE
jgi:voltage-gated potassium channel